MTERGNIYQSLIATGQQSLKENGALPSSLAQLSQSSGIAEKDVRDNFASIDDLRDGLIYQGIVLLNDALRMATVSSDPKDPVAQLRALAKSYGLWAESNPDLFHLIVTQLNGPVPKCTPLYRFSISMRDLFERKFAEMKQIGILDPNADLGPVMRMLHCLLKGTNTILTSHDKDPWFDGEQSPASTMIESVFNEFMRSVIAVHKPV